MVLVLVPGGDGSQRPSCSWLFLGGMCWGSVRSEGSFEKKQERAISMLTSIVFWGISQEENETNDACDTDTVFCALD